MTIIVLVHGVGLDRHMWTEFARVLDRPVRTYDLIGLGSGPHPGGPYSLDQYAEQLAGIVGKDVVDLVGFSMGALVAQRFTIDHPSRVRRLVLVSGVFDRSPQERTAIAARVDQVRSGAYLSTIEPALERWFTPAFGVANPGVIESVRQRMLANDPEAYACAYEVFSHGDSELVSELCRITAPTLVVAGGCDERSTPAMAERMVARMTTSTCVVMPMLRHLIPLEAPAELASLVGNFLNEIGDTDG